MTDQARNEIRTDNAPAAVGPYSQAIQHGRDLYVSGQIGLDPEEGSLVSDSVEEQTHRAIKNLQAILKEAGAGLENVVKVNVYLTNIDHYPEMNAVYENMFPDPYPSRAALEVGKLPKNALVEIDAVAKLEQD